MNFWRQTNHVMNFFKEENFRGDKRLPPSFMAGFLEVSRLPDPPSSSPTHTSQYRAATRLGCHIFWFLNVYKAIEKKKVPPIITRLGRAPRSKPS